MTAISAPASFRDRAADDRAIGWWLLLCAGMVFAIVVIGGVTRLTHSGLSIAVWEPLAGALPPLSDAEWKRVFDLYKQTPEYREVNAGMSLAAFQGIFWWEWAHRLFARLIGVVFLVPFVWFWLSGRVRRPLMPRLIGLFLLGGLQGLVGWLMVASGLVDRPSVSHYRLAAHLSTALLIYSCMLWQAFSLLSPPPEAGRGADVPALRRHAAVALGLAVVTLFWGALVAGLHAGLVYNTFPLMNGALLPGEAWFYQPVWINPFENPATVQFCHRWLAIATALTTLGLVGRMLRRPDIGARARRVAAGLGGMVALQITLGVGTLVMAVPIPLAAAHQAGAFALIGLLILTLHTLRRVRTVHSLTAGGAPVPCTG